MRMATLPLHNETNDTATSQHTEISLPSNREVPSPPAPSVCNNRMTSLPSDKTKKTYESSNIVVDWNNLKRLVESNLGLCKVCKGNSQRLVKKSIICYVVTVAIHCKDCEKRNSYTQAQIMSQR